MKFSPILESKLDNYKDLITGLKECMQVIESDVPVYKEALSGRLQYLWYESNHMGQLLKLADRSLHNYLTMRYNEVQYPSALNQFHPSAVNPASGGNFSLNLSFPAQNNGFNNTQVSNPNREDLTLFCEETQQYKRYKRKEIISLSSMDFLSRPIDMKPLNEFLKDDLKGFPKEWTGVENLSFKTSLYNTVEVDLKSNEALRVIDQVVRTSQSVSAVFGILKFWCF